MLSVLILGVFLFSCEKQDLTPSTNPTIDIQKGVVPNVAQREKLYKVYCPKSGCGYSETWGGGCTLTDPYNAFIQCPWCQFQWLKHSSESGVCNH